MRASSRNVLFYGALLAATLVLMTVATVDVAIDKYRARSAGLLSRELRCLAENVYYESRGELLVGQYAVAEVTMNRVASAEFPNSVCEVVHQKGAFSWTFRTIHLPPHGYEWRRAQAVASSVYQNLEAPLVNGALFYHATDIRPAWASTRTQVAVVGHHLFYL